MPIDERDVPVPPRMILPAGRRGLDDAGLRRLRRLVGEAADELGVPRPVVTVDLGGESPNAQAAAAGRSRARVRVNFPLTAAALDVQRWFAAHEVGHLRLGRTRPLRTRLTGGVALGVYLAAVMVPWPVTVLRHPSLVAVGVLPMVVLMVAVLCGWLAFSQAEEYAADRLAVRVLQAWGQDPLYATRAVMDQAWFGPRGRAVTARVSTHPTVERRLVSVERAVRQGPVGLGSPPGGPPRSTACP